MKINVKWWKIKRKSLNLTQISFEMIQLIAGCKAFHSKFLKTNIDVQDVNSSFSFDQNWNGAEMSYDYTETNGARIDSLNMEKSRIDHEPFFRREERFL